jgi:acetyl esterase/lipase
LLGALAMSALLIACSGNDATGTGTPIGTQASPEDTGTLAPTVPPSVDGAAVTTVASSGPESVDTSATIELPLPAPEGDAFYAPPDPIPGSANGDLIWARALEPAPAGTVAWQVLYRSESISGSPIAVSGVVMGPAGSDAGADLRPVLSWAHGTTGLADRCAPSREFGGEGSQSLLASAVVTLGYTFVATDYEGLGTPGVHPYLVGQSEGRGVLDIVRAAAQLAGAGVSLESPVAIFGHSQGGHAALMAGELAATYAPELDVVGTVAVAPPGDIALIERGSSSAGPFLTGGFSLMIDAGFAAAYPDLPVDALIGGDGIDALDVLARIADTCTTEAFELGAELPGIQRDGSSNAQWLEVYEANSPGNVAPSAPVLITHGSADDVVPPVLSELIEADYCALGVPVQRTLYDGADHSSVMIVGLLTVQSWLADRLAGEPAPTSCPA